MAAEKKPNILFDTLNALFTNKEYINDLTKETIKIGRASCRERV